MKASLFCTLLLAAACAHAQHKHVHGEGRLDVAVDKDMLVLELELPLDVAVGFERAPQNAKEQAALADVAARLKDAGTLWHPAPAAQCRVQSVEVNLPGFKEGGHADVEARHVFRCAQPAALNSVETTLFKTFKRLYRIEAQRAGPAGQGARRLTPNQPALRW